MAVVLCKKCLQRFPSFNTSSTCLLLRYLTAQSAQVDTSTDHSPNVDVARTTSSKDSRDKLKVLSALASTIQPVPNAPLHGFFEDPFLMPRTSTRKNEFLKAREEGKKAAEYVIKTYPDLFPLRKAEPEWPKELPVHIKGENEKTLLSLISAQQTKRAINLYERLISNGKPVSLECENKLLELTGYYGIQQSSPQEEQAGDLVDQVKNKWSSNNYADKLFKKMTTKNGRTYEAMIMSLLKFQRHKYASNIFDEMNDKGLKGDVFFYNQLINSSEQLCLDKEDPWSFAQDIVKLMNTEPVVRPDIGTFQNLMKVCSAHCPEPYENGLLLFREMYSLNIEPSLGCYTYLLEAAEKNGQGHGAVIDIVSHLKSLNHHVIPESTKDYEFFVSAMATARHFRDGAVARQLFELAESNNFKAFLGQRPLSFYGNLLCSLALSEHPNTVMNMYHELVPKYFVPREWIYIELLRCVERSKQPHRAIELYNDIKHHRVNMTVYTCRSLVSCFSVKLAKEHLPEYVRVMEEVFKWMEFFDVELDDFMKSQMIRIYCLNGQIEDAWERLETFSETNFMPTFPALSSLLQGTLSTKEKDKAQKIFEMLASQGFRLNASLRNSYYRALNFTADECYKIDQLFSNLPSRRPPLSRK